MAPKPTCSAYKCRFHLGIGLVIGSSSFAFADADTFNTRNRFWDSMGLSWTAGTAINVKLTSTNNAPTVANVIPNQTGTVGTAFSYAFPTNTFNDADATDTLTYSATKADDSILPTWLTFDAATRTFSGTPTTAETVSVKVTASDGNGGSVSDDFDITVSATPAAGAPAITAPNVFRVPAVLSVDLSGITDTDGVTGIATTATYKWQRFDSTGANLETDSIGTDSTYTLTDADAGKTLKVVVSFSDDGGNSEGPLTSDATRAIAAAATCNAPTLTGGATLLGSARKVTVKQFDLGVRAWWGFSKSANAGSIGNASFTTADTEDYEILGVATRANHKWWVVLDVAIPTAVQRTVAVHFCDEDIAFGPVTPSEISGDHHYFGPALTQTWSQHAERTIYLSQDTTAPTLTSATVNGTSLVMNFTEPLGAAASLANTAFAGKKNSVATALTFSATAPAISGSTVTLTLAAASSVSASDTNVLVSYTKPTTGTANKLVDAAGNEAATFTDQPVGNLLADSTAPELTTANTAVLAADGLTLTLTYNEALKTTSVPDRDVFTVEATPMGGSEETLNLAAASGVSVTGSTVVLKLARPMAHNDGSVKVTYAKPTTGAVIEDATGNPAAGFSDQAVENLSTVPRISIAAMYPDVSSLIALPVLRVTRSNAGAADDLRVNLNVTQSAPYVAREMEAVFIKAGETSTMGTISLDYPGNTNGDLTYTVAPSNDYAPALAPNNAATMLVKAPASGLPLSIRHDQTSWTVNEGDTADVTVTFTLAPGLAEPRDAYEVYLGIEREEAELGDFVDPTNFQPTAVAAAGAWQMAGGVMTQTVTISTVTLQDTEVEANERFYLYFTLANNDQSLDILLDDPQERERTTVFILDDDPVEVTGVAVTSTPGGGYYGVGDTIEFTVTFNAYMLVTGQPQFEFQLGRGTRQALGQEIEDEMEVTFEYTIVAGDGDDRDGISWGANALRLNGGSIVIYAKQDVPGIPRIADLDHGRQATLPGHKVDVAIPTLTSATVNGTSLVMNFTEPLGAAASLANTAFRVEKNGVTTALTLSSTAPAISGSMVTLTLAAASSVSASDTNVLVSYTKPTTGTANKLVDAAGKEAASFTDQPVGNLLADSTAPELAAAVLAADGLTLTLTYNEALKTTSVPDRDVFTVEATPIGGSEETLNLAATSGVSVTGSTVVLKLARPMAHNDGSVKVTYAKPTTGAVIEDATGNDAAGFSDQAVTNNSTVPRVSIAAVYPDATPGIAPPVFRFTRSNTGTAPLTLNLTGTQDANYITFPPFIRIPANATTYERAPNVTYLGNTSGNLTLTVAGGDDHLPALAPNDSASVLMKMPPSGPVALVTQPPAYSVREGELVNERLIATTGAGVARPRASFTVAIYTTAGTATINTDYNHISVNVPFPVSGWTATGRRGIHANTDAQFPDPCPRRRRARGRRNVQDNTPEHPGGKPGYYP